MGQMQGIVHADILVARMSRYPSRVRQLLVTFDSPETAVLFDSIDDFTLIEAITRVLHGR